MQSCNMWVLVISFFCLEHFQDSIQAAACISFLFLFVAIRCVDNNPQKTDFWVMPTWRPFWKSLLWAFKSLFLHQIHFSTICLRSSTGSYGMHCLPHLRVGRVPHSVCHAYVPTSFSHPQCVYTPVCCLFFIVVLVFISLMTEWTVTMFLFLIGCCVFSLEEYELKTIDHFQRFILLFYLCISLWVCVHHLLVRVLRDQKAPD